MSAGAAALAQLDRAGRKIQLIVSHQDGLGVDLVEVATLLTGPPLRFMKLIGFSSQSSSPADADRASSP